MAEEDFFSIFIERLREELKKIIPQNSTAPFIQQLYLRYWNPCERCEKPSFPIIVCDGSFGKSDFTGGLTFWVARAISHVYLDGTHLKKAQNVGVKAGYRLEGQSFFMKAIELRTLRNAIEDALREHGQVFALYDGSLYLTFLHHKSSIKAKLEPLKEYISELSSLLKLTMENNVKLIGVSKDSNITYLRAYILFEELSRIGIFGLDRYRSIKPMREKLKEVIKFSTSEPIKDYLSEIERDESDELIFHNITKEPGFTTPLLLAPQTCYIGGEGERHKKWSESHLRTKSPKEFNLLLEEMDVLYSLPPIALTYWKPKHCLRTYRLDIPSNILGCNARCDELTSDKLAGPEAIKSMEELIGSLNWLDKEAYGIGPLLEVDEIVRFTQNKYKSTYERVILEELKAHGIDVKIKKRSLRDELMRRY